MVIKDELFLLEEKVQLTQSELLELQGQMETVTNSHQHKQDPNKSESKQNLTGSEQNNKTGISLFESDLANLSVNVANVDLRQQVSKHISYTGKIIWKIDRFEYRMSQAVQGKITGLHSPPCFDGRYGYKFCGRVYLNGDGLGKCTHLSFYFVLMKSPYDELLAWPFQKRVTLKIYNQDDSKRSIQEVFMPDSYSSSFKKPTKITNVAAGCPLFISKDQLLHDGFVKNDCLYLEISLC